MIFISISKDKLINKENIEEELFPIWLSDVDYITRTGDVYLDCGNNKFYKRSIFQNKYNGYLYVALRFKDGEIRQRRHHILMAKTFIFNPNPKIYNVVGHKNNIKYDNRLENLYWTTNQENSQKAVDDGLNKNKVAENNEQSNYVKVIDKNTYEVVGVYGSYRECNRKIENTDITFISKMCNNNKLYKPRHKKYIYLKSYKEEFESYPSLQNIHLIENPKVDKSPKIFRMINAANKSIQILDNQTTAEKITGIPQAIISRILRENDHGVYNGWKFEYISKTTYKESTAYENQINTVDSITVKNINDGRVMEFKTSEDLKDYFGLNGHDINQYIITGHTLLSEWKVIEKKEKNNVEITQKVG